MDNFPLMLSSTAVGIALGAMGRDNLKGWAVKLASRAIDAYIELKWMLAAPVEQQEKPSQEEQAKPEWLLETENYKIYKLNDEAYITFNMTHQPSLHFEDGTIEDIIVLRNDNTKAAPSETLKEVLIKCGGHGCTFSSGVPTLEQLSLLPSAEITEELKNVKKIIINTTTFEEHVVSSKK
jgi:hypothetical protein